MEIRSSLALTPSWGRSPLARPQGASELLERASRQERTASPAPEGCTRPLPKGFGARLDSTPLFAPGIREDEMQLDTRNIGFAATQLGLDADFAGLVTSTPAGSGMRFSVLYHDDGQGPHVDAYRLVASTGKNSAVSAYITKDPAFDPTKAYRNEMLSKVGDRYLGTVLTSKHLTVPDSPSPELSTFLSANGYTQGEASTLGDLAGPASHAALTYFGLPTDLGVHSYEPPKRSFTEQFKVFYQLTKESPEYRALKIGDVLTNIGSAMLMGVITPELWKQGTAYGVASTISSISNIGGPALGILGENALGSVVDNAVNSTRPLEALKKVNLEVASAYAVKIGCNVAMHPALVHLMGSHPGWAFTGLYAASTGIGALSGVVSGKAEMAIHDQIINKSPKQHLAAYAHNYYQILGVEASLARITYLGSYSATVAALAAFPAASLPIAAVGGAVWAGSQFIFPVYHEKPEAKATIEGTSFVHKGNRYVFDSGWEVAFDGADGHILKEDDTHYSVSVDEGSLLMRSTGPVTEAHSRSLSDFVPGLRSLKMLGAKETWNLDNGGHSVEIARYGRDGYTVSAGAPGEFLLHKG